MPDLIIFDCDGVLVDTEHEAAIAVSAYLEELGITMSVEACEQAFTGMANPAMAEWLQERGHALPDRFSDELSTRVIQALSHGVDPIPGIAEVLDDLDLRFCVASSGKHAKIRQSLRLAGLMNHFHDGNIFSREDVANPKPAPDMFLLAAQKLGVVPVRTLVVEDSHFGIRAGKAAGMSVAAFVAAGDASPQKDMAVDAGADVIFHEMESLPAIIREHS